MLIVLIILVTILSMLVIYTTKFIDKTAGMGMGMKNNNKWGTTDEHKDYHE